MRLPDDVRVMEASLKSRRCAGCQWIKRRSARTSAIRSETSYATRNPCSTASSLEKSVQKRSCNVSTFDSSSVVSAEVRRRSEDGLREVCESDSVESTGGAIGEGDEDEKRNEVELLLAVAANLALSEP